MQDANQGGAALSWAPAGPGTAPAVGVSVGSSLGGERALRVPGGRERPRLGCAPLWPHLVAAHSCVSRSEGFCQSRVAAAHVCCVTGSETASGVPRVLEVP